MVRVASAVEPVWKLQPGETIKRKKLHEEFGGSGQGGIAPSRGSHNVFIFTDPAAGEEHGYFDGWMPDGLFHYSGKGQRGDQQMKSGNASILYHRSEGRALRVFQGASGTVSYLGEFEVDPDDPWYEADAPETGGGPIRRVIVFRLRSVDAQVQPPQTTLGRLIAENPDPITAIPVEQQLTERSFVNPNRKPYEAERKESVLVQALAGYLRTKGRTVGRHQIRPQGESRPLFTDLYVDELDLLIEAKGSATRENVRMAIGQLADYGRFFPTAKRAILLPAEPKRMDLIDLAHSQDIALLWPEGKAYCSSDSALSM